MWVGVGVGAVLLGWVGWQFWGTNWVAHREQHRATSALRSQWEKGGTRLVPR